MRVESSECGKCGICIDFCPLGLIEKQGFKIVIHEGCTDCKECLAGCPLGAIKFDN
ncbi:4Fe-4S dicluster domain-containing protein [Methanobrevibacter curvatus]|uniref:4Fe-4S dicluster domain-containing protein n=1 Tax=Methanobrevibacter curvatus TaxID=49547 RepID=UPI000A02E145|nr:4Fe-4S dicluster domain-containing protein [Methanobrevibacter curvatus]